MPVCLPFLQPGEPAEQALLAPEEEVLVDLEAVDFAAPPDAGEPEPLAEAGAVPVTDRGTEVEPVDERARRLAQHHERLLAGRRDLGRAARAG